MVETVKKFHLIKEMPVCIHLTIVTSFFHIMFSYIWGLFKLARGDLKKKKLWDLVYHNNKTLPQILWNLYITDLVDEENFQI